MKQLYLVLAVIGAVVPCVFLWDFFGTSGTAPGALFAAIFANPASTAVTADVLLSSLAFWVFMFSRPAAPRPWLFIALNLAVGLSCALPAYLYADARLRAY
jgi:Terpene cyclase DEP1